MEGTPPDVREDSSMDMDVNPPTARGALALPLCPMRLPSLTRVAELTLNEALATTNMAGSTLDKVSLNMDSDESARLMARPTRPALFQNPSRLSLCRVPPTRTRVC